MKDGAAVVVGVDRIGAGLDRLVVVGESAVDVLLGFVGGRAAVEIVGIRGIEAQGLAVIADRAVEIALGEFCDAAEVVGIGQIFQRLTDHGVAALIAMSIEADFCAFMQAVAACAELALDASARGRRCTSPGVGRDPVCVEVDCAGCDTTGGGGVCCVWVGAEVGGEFGRAPGI